MRTVRQSSQFKPDLKREARGTHRAALVSHFTEIVKALACDEPLPGKHHDHALVGSWRDHRDCHVQPDLILIYRKPDPTELHLVRLGSHSELGL